LAIDVEEVVGIPVARLETKLPDSDTAPGVQVDDIPGLDLPTCLDEGRVDPRPRTLFRGVKVRHN
jgi:hypothetical protein